jgi:hypothetical protein
MSQQDVSLMEEGYRLRLAGGGGGGPLGFQGCRNFTSTPLGKLLGRFLRYILLPKLRDLMPDE